MTDQKRTELDWDDVRVFLAVAREKSLSGAARQLGINHATVSRRVASLERRMGSSPLFEKSRDGYVLTLAGERAFIDAQAMEVAADSLRLGAETSEELQGVVRVSATTTFAEHLLVEPLAEVAREQPGLRIDLSADDRNVSLARGEADIAVRQGRPASGDALARMLGTVSHRLYASPFYLESVPTAERRLIGYSETVAKLAPGVRRLDELAGGAGYAMRAPTLAAQANAAAAGAGIALLPAYLAEGDNRLALVDPRGEPNWRREVWLVVRKDVQRVRRVRFVADRLISALAKACR